MGFFDDARDFGVGAFGVGAVGAGFGYSIYKTYSGTGSPVAGLGKTFSTLKGPGSRPFVQSTASGFGSVSMEAFYRAQEAGFAVMGREGWKAAVRRAAHASALGSGKLPFQGVKDLLAEIDAADPSDLLKILQAKEREVGGIGSVYESLSGILGGRRTGTGGKELSEIISGLGERYTTSAFGTSGSFWKEHLKFSETLNPVAEATLSPLHKLSFPSVGSTPQRHAKELQAALQSMGVNATVVPGVREMSQAAGLQNISDPGTVSGRRFRAGSGYQVKRSLGGKTVNIPYAELEVTIGKTRAYVPLQYAKRGLIASGKGMMSTAAVGNFTVPVPGGGRRLVQWNEALSMMLYGEGGQVGDNLATMIHKATQAGKSHREAVLRFGQLVRSQVREITVLPHVNAGKWTSTSLTSTAGAMINALKHQFSYVPLEEMMVRGLQSGSTYTTAEQARIMRAAEQSGIPAYPLESPIATAKSARFSTMPFHERWDLFGKDFLYERRPMQIFRDFEPTQAAVESMKSKPIYGRISRDIPITATKEYVKEVVQSGYRAPNVVMAYMIGEAQSLRPEEVFVSRNLSSMMETQTLKTHYLNADFGSVAPGTELAKGMPLGVDTTTGRMIYSSTDPGKVTERVVGSETAGGITKLTVARQFQLQPQTKIFGVKATLRPAEQEAMERAAEAEWGIGRGARWGLPKAEAYGSIDLLKKNPAMIKRQMTEALMVLAAKRASVLESTGRDAPDIIKKLTGRGGKRYLRKAIGSATGKYGVEQTILTMAKGMGLTAEELGWIGGYWLQTETKKISEMAGTAGKTAAQELDELFKNVGLTSSQVEAIRGAKVVIGAPTFYSGDYPDLNKWERGSIEPRGIKELLLQDWETQKGTKIGQMLAGELEKRRIPMQSLEEMENVLYSLAGRGPAGLETVSAKEAVKRLEAGQGGFMFNVPKAAEVFEGTSIYVPSDARLMGYFANEVGEEMPQTLLSNYLKTANAAMLAEAGEEGGAEAFRVASKGLKDAAYKEWLMSTQARGGVAGTQAPVMQSWLGKSKHFETIDDFVSSRQAFTIGIGRETLRESFIDLMRLAPEGEKAGIQAAMERAMKTGEAYGFEYRHPTIYPYSITPVRYKITDQASHGVFHPTLTVGNKKVDVSGMLAMAADTDFDRAVVGVVTDEKMVSAVQETINDTRFRRQYAQAMEMQYDLETLAKKQIGLVSGDYTRMEGLKRLAGMQVATPEVSVAAQKLKAALHHSTDPQQKLILSSFITQLEQRAISAKKGGEAEIISKAISNTVTAFVQGESGLAQTKDEFTRAWTSIWGSETFKAGDATFDVHQMYKQVSGLMDQAKAGEHIEYADRIVRRAARANRGASVNAGSMDEIMQEMKAHRAGIGDPAAHLVRSMRSGPGSARATAGAMGMAATSRWGTLKAGLAKHWKYPAMGLGAAVGARYLFGSSSLDMPEPTHDQKATEEIMNMPKGPPPVNMPYQPSQVIQTYGNSFGSPGVHMSSSVSGAYSLEGTRQIANFAGGLSYGLTGASVTLRDDRGSITPEYIRKQMDERYY